MPVLKPGSFKLGDMSLYSEVTGFTVPLNTFANVIEFNVYEGMFTDSMSGNILLTDSNNLIANFPIIGNEKLSLTFYTSTSEEDTEERVSKTFRVYSVDSYSKENFGTSSYILNFTSEEYIKSCNSIVSKSFSNLAISEIVNRIYSFLDTGKEIDIEKTEYLHDLIVPSMTPFKALNWLTKYAVSTDYKGANYLFFETFEGYNFKSLESCMDVQDEDIYATYFNIPPRTQVDYKGDYFLIREFRVKKNFNIMKNLLDGMYSSRTITHDIINRTKKIIDFNYKDSYSYYKHVEYNKRPGGQRSTMLAPEKIDSDAIDFFENPQSNLNLNLRHSNLFSSDARKENTQREKTLQIRKSQMAQLTNLGVEVVIEGDLKIRCGYIVKINIPSSQSAQGSWLWDPYLSGRYIVTSIKHSFSTGQHMTTLVLNKDSYYNPIDLESDLLENINKGVE